MAGSKRLFQYKTNTGLVFAIQADESNTEAANTTLNAAELNPTSDMLVLPVARFCRYARYVSEDGRVSRKVIVLTPAVASVLPKTMKVAVSTGASTQEDITVTLVKDYPEKFSRARPGTTDTGLVDGDGATPNLTP